MEGLRQFVKGFTGGDGSPSALGSVAEYCAQIGEGIAATASQVQYGKLMLLATFVWLALELAWAWAMAAAGGWSPLLFLEGPILNAGKAAVWRVAARLAWDLAEAAVTQAVLETTIEAIQKSSGFRSEFDASAIGVSAGLGAIGGVVAMGVGSAVGEYAPHFAAKIRQRHSGRWTT